MAVLDATNPATARTADRERRGTASVDVDVISPPVGRRARFGRPASMSGRRIRTARSAVRCSSLRHGRYPKTADEVALTDHGAPTCSASASAPGSSSAASTRTVVGRVENPSDLSDEFALIAPDGRSAGADDDAAVRLRSTAAVGRRRRRRGAARASSGSRAAATNSQVAALVLVATTLVLALVGLIAAAGFVVVAQRRQRQLGLLAAIGATERHLRLVMVANGAIVGVGGRGRRRRARRPRLDRRRARGRGRGELPHRPASTCRGR